MGKNKFKQKWTSTVFLDDDEPDGTFDLRTMDDNGIGGFHYVNAAKLKVEAVITTTSDGFELLTLTIENGDIYRGVLVVDTFSHKHMVVAGKLHVGTLRKKAKVDAAAFDQDDPPWVITKP